MLVFVLSDVQLFKKLIFNVEEVELISYEASIHLYQELMPLSLTYPLY